MIGPVLLLAALVAVAVVEIRYANEKRALIERLTRPAENAAADPGDDTGSDSTAL